MPSMPPLFLGVRDIYRLQRHYGLVVAQVDFDICRLPYDRDFNSAQ